MIKRLTRYIVNEYFKKITKNKPDTVTTEYLKSLLLVFKPDSFNQDLLGFNSQQFFIHSQYTNIESEIKTILLVTSVLIKKKSLFRDLFSNEIKRTPLRLYLTNNANKHLDITSALKGLVLALNTFFKTYDSLKGDSDEITKANIFFLNIYLDNLSTILENLISIQLNKP